MEQLSVNVFVPIVAELQALAKEAQEVDVTDEKAVREVRLKLKNKRVEVTKKCKEFRDDANAFAKAVIAKEKELVSIIEPEEERFKEIEAAAKLEKEREERRALLPQRLERLASIGDKVLEESEPDFETFLLDMDGSAFEGYFNQRLAAKNAADRAEIERKEAEIREKEEAAKREEEAKEREEKARQEEKEKQEREEKEELQRRTTSRINHLRNFGLVFVDSTETYQMAEDQRFVEEQFMIGKAELETMSEDEWSKLFATLQEDFNRRLKAAKDEEEAAIEAEKLAKRERAEKYKQFRAELGYTEETASDFYEKVITEDGVDTKVVLFKKVGEFDLNLLK
jgi:hypothetical protein